MPFVLPAFLKTLLPELSPPEQMYPVILLLKMPQWFSPSLLGDTQIPQAGIDKLSTIWTSC